MCGLEETVRSLKTQLQQKVEEISRLHRDLTSAQTRTQQLQQDKTDAVSRLEVELGQLRREKERERDGERRKEEDLKRSLEQSEGVRRSLLAQVERNGQELEKMTERLRALQQRESEAERSLAEASQLHHLVTPLSSAACNIDSLVPTTWQVSELQREKRERESEVKECQEEQRRLKVELGKTQARLSSLRSQLQQARDR